MVASNESSGRGSRHDYEERAARNDASRNKADLHREEWDGDDVVFLLLDEWDGTEETLAVIAELLGRTVEACRQRFYTAKKAVVTRRFTTQGTERKARSAAAQERYIGALDDPEDVWWQ